MSQPKRNTTSRSTKKVPKKTAKKSVGRTVRRSAGKTAVAGRPLVIVESPNKLKTIAAILGGEFTVRASYGHVTDIPASDDAVDTENGFAVEYGPTDKGAEVLAGLAADLAVASELILATDDDREGEMIAAQLVEQLAPTVPVSRIVFHAITEDEVRGALENRRPIDARLVEAARTRRVLDHLYGFRVSPVLWSKLRNGLSAGRVQSPALALVVEREFARRAFVPTPFCGVEATLAGEPAPVAVLGSLGGIPVATSKDIDDAGRVDPAVRVLDPAEAAALAAELEGGTLRVSAVRTQRYTRRPRPPYVTSDLLSDIVNRLNTGPARAQALMNQLHEHGHISYPRTDSPSLSPQVTMAARAAAVSMFGENSVPDKPNWYRAARRSAQQAHEAIRPANMSARTLKGLTPQHRTVYEMIWRRTVASQMANATGTTHTVTLETESAGFGACVFAASGTVIEDPGFRRLFDDGEETTPLVVHLGEGDTVDIAALTVHERTTRPPARYTAATLIKALEEREIGRPSTYASAIESLRREYLWSRRGDRALIPTISGIAVAGFLARRFPSLVDPNFTREMEERLERIVEGEGDYDRVLSGFFHGGDDAWPPLAELIESTLRDHDPREHPVMVMGTHPVTGEQITLHVGKMFKRHRKGDRRTSGSPYLKCGERNLGINDQTEFAALTLERVVSLLAVPKEGLALGEREGRSVTLKVGPYGPYVTDGEVFASVPESVDELASVTLGEAWALIGERRSAIVKKMDKGIAS